MLFSSTPDPEVEHPDPILSKDDHPVQPELSKLKARIHSLESELRLKSEEMEKCKSGLQSLFTEQQTGQIFSGFLLSPLLKPRYSVIH